MQPGSYSRLVAKGRVIGLRAQLVGIPKPDRVR